MLFLQRVQYFIEFFYLGLVVQLAKHTAAFKTGIHGRLNIIESAIGNAKFLLR